MSQAQDKILGIIKKQIESLGFEVVSRPQWANTGTLGIEHSGQFGELACVTYQFNGDCFTLAIYKTAGGREVGVQSQPPREGYFDHYMKYSAKSEFATFQAHLLQTLEEIAK
jgi:hypothetical protein